MVLTNEIIIIALDELQHACINFLHLETYRIDGRKELKKTKITF